MAKLLPEPENIFRQFIKMYYERCREKCSKIEAIAVKWNFEDLIPGMSDFDTRFLCSDDMSVEDWCDMSMAVGEVHLDMAREYTDQGRALIHLPGINLTWEEMLDDFTYYPEYKLWSFYHTEREDRVKQIEDTLKAKKWDSRDEYFHLNKFFTFYGPYNSDLDFPTNIGKYICKYPLHSRIMHYFAPPVQSGVSIILNRSVKGKKQSLREASKLFDHSVFKECLEVVERHYEGPELYEKEYLDRLNRRLYSALNEILGAMKEKITVIPAKKKKSAEEIKDALKEVEVAPQMLVFSKSRFSRLMKGRLWYFAKAPSHIDKLFLIRNELNRIGENFYGIPYRAYWKVIKGEEIDNPDRIVPELVPQILTSHEAEATLKFSKLVYSWQKGKEIETALEIVEIYDHFFKGLNKIKKEIEGAMR